MTKFLKTIRFDASDERVFERAASPGEWAISGAFEFFDLPAELLVGRIKQAFANGFLGLTSFGRSTFASVDDIDAETLNAIQTTLARHFMEHYGAPALEAAQAAAREEIGFIGDLCADSLVNTVFTVRRTLDAEGGIKEEFRKIRAPDGQPLHTRIWSVVEDDG